ncbi:MAG: VCBS repeat-containing protein [Anaerolineaceae bacterium]|nr:VCBS repeat-containing protein [Anaerolineaceae bacterium]
MSRRSILILLAFVFGWCLAACAASEQVVSTQNVIPSISNTASPDPSPFVEDSLTPTPHKRVPHTPVPILTQAAYLGQFAISRTPSTLTPTPIFEIHSIQTSTLAPPAKCPQILLPKKIPTLEYNGEDRRGVNDLIFLDYLNQFGANDLLLADQYNRNEEGQLDSYITLHRDLTNDGVPEIVVSRGEFYILGCQDGQYKTLLSLDMNGHEYSPQIVAITDLNQNGIPELLVRVDIGTQDDSAYKLFEWGNGKFNSLLNSYDPTTGDENDGVWLNSGGSISFQDVDHDGLKEIVLHQGTWLCADYMDNGSDPLRRIIEIFKWNGQSFLVSKTYFDPPQYRFQAVEDADHDVLDNEYDQALALYQRVIFDPKLDWWTDARKNYLADQICSPYTPDFATETPLASDPKEYLYEAAYARFRIMVLHLMRGYQSDAQVVYQTLLKKFPDGTPGSVYADMAQAFWDEYQASHGLGQACGKAQDVASQRLDEATRYLFDDYANYGEDGKANYTVQQLCPFN